MRSKYMYATKLEGKVFSSFLCLSALKNKNVEITIRTKSKYPLSISSIRTSANFSIPKTYNHLFAYVDDMNDLNGNKHSQEV